jgi:putative hemin transport protein
MLAEQHSLAERWAALLSTEPKLRPVDAAERLGVSEAELVAAGLGRTATRLVPRWAELLAALPTVGRVMALTRNDHCVHEKKGAYENVSAEAMHALVLGRDIDLRIFPKRWRFGFALADGEKRSLQFFSRSGRAVHKVHALAETDLAAWEMLVERFRLEPQEAALALEPEPREGAGAGDAGVDAETLRQRWGALQDTHDFFPMLRRLKLSRLGAFRAVGAEFARPAPLDAAPRILEAAARTGLPIMVFVGNQGCIQIHTGPVRTLRALGPWFNVLDDGFNLHLRQDRVAEAWRVRKPTSDGDVTSVELFDQHGETIAQLFGERKPGSPELPEWRRLLDETLR